jgi:DNA-binding NtrC family response regulator
MSAVDHPPHYQANGIEAIDVIEAFGLGFRLGNAVKYILRGGRKGPRTEDLRKARWYLDREIAKTQSSPEKAPAPPPAPAPALMLDPSVVVVHPESLREFREGAERVYITAVLDEHKGNVTRTAAFLGIERTNLHKKMRTLGVTRSRSAERP